MPGWVTKSIPKKTYRVAASAAAAPLTETDPALTNEVAAADDQRGFLNVETMDAGMTLFVYRYEGARADLMRRTDPAGTAHLTITAAGIYPVSWTTPAGAARKVQIDAWITPTASGLVTVELDDVYRTTGG